MAGYTGRGLHGQVVESLGARIVHGEVGEAEIIDPAALIADLGVSQTVIREALKVLSAKGLVAARQKHGTFVRPRAEWNLLDADVIRWQFSSAERHRLLGDLSEVREIVEPAAARRAAQRRTDEDLTALQTALAAMETGGDPAAAAAADLAWHQAVLAATHNELLQRMDIFIGPGLAERDLLVHAGHATGDPVPEHRPVLDAIRAQDADAAERAMRALLARAADDQARTLEHPDSP